MQAKRDDVKTSNNKRNVMNTFFDMTRPFDLQGIPVGLFALIALTSVAILQLENISIFKSFCEYNQKINHPKKIKNIVSVL